MVARSHSRTDNVPMLHRTLRAALSAAVPAALAIACGTEQGIRAPSPTPPSADTRQAALWLVGDWSSAEQSAKDPSFQDIVIHIRPIWTDRTDGMWMYVEQAMAASADRPYRQRVYQMVTAPDGSTESRIFELPGDPIVHAGAWKRPQPLDDLEPELLQPRAGCTVHLTRQKGGPFTGATRSGECATEYRGATYTMSDVTLSADELATWDRGYDAKGTQVWGSTSGPYIFRRGR
jgi:CpeT protein